MTVALAGNNPGGMNDGTWAKAQPGYAGPNGRYASFKTLTDGVNAMQSLLLNSYIKKGFNTPRKVAAKWAPDNDEAAKAAGRPNNSLAYAQRIAAGMKIGLDDTIHPADAIALTLIQAQIENPAFPAAWLKEQQRRNGPAKASA